MPRTSDGCGGISTATDEATRPVLTVFALSRRTRGWRSALKEIRLERGSPDMIPYGTALATSVTVAPATLPEYRLVSSPSSEVRQQ